MTILSTAKDESEFASALVVRLPASIRISCYDFRFQIMTTARAAAGQRWGECSTCEQMISVQEWMPSRHKAVDTFIHEISHAIFWAYGVHDDDKEERIVGLMASGWAAFYRDNPWFIDWLRSAEL